MDEATREKPGGRRTIILIGGLLATDALPMTTFSRLS